MTAPLSPAAAEVLGFVAWDLGEDHRVNMRSEGSWRQHRRDEPDCSYCAVITKARRIMSSGRKP